jgi:Tfp pilus assembly protein PilN
MKRINLLPPEARVKASRERGLIYAVLFLVAVVVVLGLVYVWQSGIVNNKQDQLDQIQAQQAVVAADAAKLAPYAAIQAQRVAMTATGKGIYQARVPWSTILEEVSLVIPENVRLQSMSCAVPASMQPGAAAAAAPAAASTDVTFAGTTYTHQDVAEFMTRLGLIPQLENIQLGSSTGSAPTPASTTGTSSTSSTPATVSFTVTAQLRPYTTPPPTTALQAGVGQ